MNEKEAEIVNQDFLKRKDVYNVNIGGCGWKCMVNTPEINQKRLNTMMKKLDYYKECFKKGRQKLKELNNNEQYKLKFRQKTKEGLKKYHDEHPGSEKTFLGKHHTDETKIKMSLQKRGKPFLNNKSIGTMWIKNTNLKLNRRIKNEDSIPDGWEKGRNMSYLMG